MTVSAYIFFIVDLGKTQEVVNALREIPNIVNVAVVTGEYDIVVKIIVENLEELFHVTTEKIHMIEGISETQTSVIEKEVLKE
ncbi:MAG: Lrp/AsnC family transcriptional regulator [Candidatus Heimdallarchaeota archaeon]|nr:Lrp/AsnC family transcriptional regulator [Candidatus Heimdallarchaeota archaeon]